ncbi:hypothetical protein F2P81_014496 [Scophthalmus maximus]|uniref:Uncharacterized protein n=1 Tax=Scophthalmus maximus TaxID=52904 RepID=A0A6A4SAI0_SCOMX|nr:hypothetical protein F2P81_014496 [Scophthalmus maximus]
MEAVRMGIAVQTGIPEVGQTGGDDEEGSAGQPTSETRSRGQPKTQTQEHALSQPSSLTQTKRPAGSLTLEQLNERLNSPSKLTREVEAVIYPDYRSYISIGGMNGNIGDSDVSVRVEVDGQV